MMVRQVTGTLPVLMIQGLNLRMETVGKRLMRLANPPQAVTKNRLRMLNHIWLMTIVTMSTGRQLIKI